MVLLFALVLVLALRGLAPLVAIPAHRAIPVQAGTRVIVVAIGEQGPRAVFEELVLFFAL